jgi:hypothetical protein
MNSMPSTSEPSEEFARPAAPEWIISNIAEASKNAQQVFFILLSLLVYSAISVTSTSDRQVVLNSTVHLPVLNTSVSLEVFFLLAPIFSLLVFIYLQLYLQRLKGLIHQLKHSYARLEPRRLYPWALIIAEDPEPGSIGLIQRVATDVSLWWLLPIVFVLFAIWSVRKHSPWLSFWVCAYPLLGLAVTLFFWRKYAEHSTRTSRSARRALIAITIAADLFIAAYLVPAANLGWFLSNGSNQDSQRAPFWTSLMHRLTCVDLSYQVLVTEQKKEYDTYWVNLEGAHLEGGNLNHTILKLANLRNAHLEGSNLQSATLRTATLEGANLQNAFMEGADLSYAKLDGIRGVTVTQICRARTLFNAKMESALEKAIRGQCPRVFSEESQDW